MQPLRFSVSVLFIVRRKNTRLYNPQKQRNVIVNNNGDRIKRSPLLLYARCICLLAISMARPSSPNHVGAEESHQTSRGDAI